MAFVIRDEQIQKMTDQRSAQAASQLLAFLENHKAHIAEKNISLIDENAIHEIIRLAHDFGFDTQGAVKALIMLIYSYSSPLEYTQDSAFMDELVKTEITPEIRIMNIHDNLKLRAIQAR